MPKTPLTPIRQTRHILPCPECKGESFDVTHVKPLANVQGGTISVGPWYCGVCGYGVCITLDSRGFFMDPHGDRCDKTRVLLRICDTHVFVEVRGHSFVTNKGDPIDQDKDKYFYEEHTCPCNEIGEAVMLVDPKTGEIDDDPHGLFEFIESRPNDDSDWKETIHAYLAGK